MLYSPEDIPESYLSWRATCGPAAFAAVVGRPLMQCRSYFPKFPRQEYCNPSDMFSALRVAGIIHRKTHVIDGIVQTPNYGLAFVQLGGSWMQPGVPAGAQYRRTHWIGVFQPVGEAVQVYDINAEAWTTAAAWKQYVLPRLVEHVKGDGTWFLRNAIEVTL